jgi:tetratricopeptide (TPR) repeat protein
MLLLKQLGVVGACLLIGIAIYIAPRSAKVNSSNTNQTSETSLIDENFQTQLTAVKSTFDVAELAQIERLEQLIKSEGQASFEKISSLNALIKEWDRLMRPGISAEYAVQKAEISNSAEDWENAGRRYYGIMSFFDDENKQLIAQKAIHCFEKAKEKGGETEILETMIAVAGVEGTNDPMSGILKLRALADANPMNVEAQLNLGFFAMQTAQYDKAIERFIKVLEADKEYLAVRFYLSEAYIATGKKDEAINQLNIIVKEARLKNEQAALEEAKKRIKNINN